MSSLAYCCFCTNPGKLNGYSLCKGCEELGKDAYIYFVEAENGLVKIGMTTTAPQKRLDSLRSMSPLPLRFRRVLRVSKQNDASYYLLHREKNAVLSIERLFHIIFDDVRTHGEWFDLEMDLHPWIFSLPHGFTAKELFHDLISPKIRTRLEDNDNHYQARLEKRSKIASRRR